MEHHYSALKTLHILGAVLFTGNILVSAVWKALADRTREPRVVAFAQRLVGLCDLVFTGFGAGLLLATGLLMAPLWADRFWTVPWIAAGLALFGASGAIWVAVLIPVQLRQARLARGFAEGGEIPGEYWRLSRIWAAAGTLATLLPLAAIYFMVHRPS
jgi:uncharacterized membrane protein